MDKNQFAIYDKVQNGLRLELPEKDANGEIIPPAFLHILSSAWHQIPQLRPDAIELVRIIREIVKSNEFYEKYFVDQLLRKASRSKENSSPAKTSKQSFTNFMHSHIGVESGGTVDFDNGLDFENRNPDGSIVIKNCFHIGD